MDALFVSALSQMWIFATYELLRTWRQFVRDLKKASAKPPNDLSDGDQWFDHHEAEVFFRREATRLQSDPNFAAMLDEAFNNVEPLFRRIERLRMNLAKHEIPKKKGDKAGKLSIAPGYGRIDETDGSIYWFVDLGDVCIDGKTYREQDQVSRRSIADSLRRTVIGHLLQTDEGEGTELNED